jgi:hypothetical protein
MGAALSFSATLFSRSTCDVGRATAATDKTAATDRPLRTNMVATKGSRVQKASEGMERKSWSEASRLYMYFYVHPTREYQQRALLICIRVLSYLPSQVLNPGDLPLAHTTSHLPRQSHSAAWLREPRRSCVERRSSDKLLFAAKLVAAPDIKSLSLITKAYLSVASFLFG